MMPRTLISVRGQEFYRISQLVDVGDEPVPDSYGIDERAGDVTKIIDVFDDGWPGARELNRGVASLPVGERACLACGVPKLTDNRPGC